MKTLFKNGTIVNVFTGELENKNLLIENDKIIGVGDYCDADIINDITGKYICPGFIDGHIHIESTMLTPAELAKAVMPHGTTAIVADPHEIANVCGTDGIRYMQSMSKNLPLKVFFMLPSCVPSTPFDESGATLSADVLKPLYNSKDVLGLAEVMNYPGVIFGEESIIKKINDCISFGKAADGHAPTLSGADLDKYITAGMTSDHECSNINEALEKLRKGQWIMIRQGTAAKNLKDLIQLFEPQYSHRCLLVTDDRHPADLINEGHIDNIIREAVKLGKSAVTGIQMATIQAAQYFGIKNTGAIAPGYKADFLILDNLNNIGIQAVYSDGNRIDINKITQPQIDKKLDDIVRNTLNIATVKPEDFYISENSSKCRVIKTIPDQLLTEEMITSINWKDNNGIDTNRDILKLAVIERHNNTGHKGLGYINGIGLKKGAIASTVSHDSHNLIIIGASDNDMAVAANHIRSIGGGYALVCDGKVIADLRLPIAGLMSYDSAEAVARSNEVLLQEIHKLGVPKTTAPLMVMAFVALSVIPHLKMTTLGLIDVNTQKIVSLFA